MRRRYRTPSNTKALGLVVIALLLLYGTLFIAALLGAFSGG